MFLSLPISHPEIPMDSPYSPAVRRVMFPLSDPGREWLLCASTPIHPPLPCGHAAFFCPMPAPLRRPHVACVKKGLVTRRMAL